MRQWEDTGQPESIRRQILKSLDPDGQVKAPVTLAFDEPIAVGEEIVVLTSRVADRETGWTTQLPMVWITVKEVHDKEGQYVATYTVSDDRPVYMAKGGGTTFSASRSIDREATYDPVVAEEYAIQARKKDAKRLEDRDEGYRAFRERLRDVRRSLSPQADVYLMASLKRALDDAVRGDFD